MKRLHRYILKAFVGPWIITFLLCVFILLMQFLWRYIDDLVGKGLDLTIILELMFYASFSLVPLALPLSGLLASIMAMGKLGETNELFAMKSGGVSLYRIMTPLVAFNLLISVVAFLFSNNLMPYTNLKMRSLLFGIQQQRPEVIIQNGIFVEPADDICIKVDSKNRTNNELNGVLIYDHRNSSTPNNVTMAATGNLLVTEDNSMMILELRNGTRHEDVKGGKYQHQSSKFERQVTYLELDATGIDKNNEEFFKGGYEMLNNSQLNFTIDSLNGALSQREQEICGNFKRFQIFRGMNGVYEGKEIYASRTVPLSIEVADDKEVADKVRVDSLCAMMSKTQRDIMLEYAVNYSRSAKTYIDIVTDEISGTRRWIVRHEMEWYRKYALSIACILFCLIGIPLGSIIRKGGFGLSVVVSVFIFLMYYIVSTTVESTVKELVVPAGWGMWFSTLLLLPLGAYLVISVANDSLRINPRVLNKILNFFKRKKSKDADDE